VFTIFYFPGQEKRPEQPVQASASWALELSECQFGRGSKRDREDLRVGQDPPTRSSRLRHSKPSKPVAQNFAQPNFSVPSNIFAQSAVATNQVPRQVSNPSHERPNGGCWEIGTVPAWDVGYCSSWELSGGSQRTSLWLARRILGSFTPTPKEQSFIIRVGHAFNATY